jgi:hypothetical protein
MIRTAAAVLVLLLSIACASTRLESSWVKPDVGQLKFKKIVAAALTRNPGRRRMLEDAMVAEIRSAAPSVQAVPSYTVVPDNLIREEERVRERIERAGFDGVVMLRITDVSHQDTYVPGRVAYAPVHYRTLWGYYRHWTPVAYRPGYVERDRNVSVETILYSTGGDADMVYAAVSRTVNPTSPKDLVEGVARAVVKDMKKKGLLPDEA